MSIAGSNTKFSLAGRVLLFLFVSAVACPVRYWPVSTDIDSGWLYGLNYAALHGLAAGRDVLSTTGPLAYLAAPQDVGRNLEWGLWFQAGIWIVLLAIFADLYFRSRIPLRSLALFTALLALASPLFWFNRVGLDNLLLAAALVSLVLYRSRGGLPRLLAALVLMGIMPLIKFTSAFIAAGAMGGFLLEQAFVPSRKAAFKRFAWQDAALAIALPVLVAGLCIMATLPWNALGPFLKSAAEMSSGYSVSMAVPGPPGELAGAVGALFLVVALLFLNGRRGRLPSIFFALLLAAPLAVSLKHGFVRQDVHVINFFCFCALALGLIALSLPLEGWRTAGTLAVVAPFLALWVGYVAPWERPDTVTGLRAARLAWGAHDLAHVRQEFLTQAAMDSRPELRIEPALRHAIGDEPVGFLANSFVLAVVLDHVPLALFPPIFPGDAYTPYLDEVSARWIRDKGPRFLLTDATAIDRRNPWAEVPATWSEVYRWYDTRMLGTWNLLLARRAEPRYSRMVSIGKSMVALRDGITLPADAGTSFWTMNCRMSTTGKLNKLLFRVPGLMADVGPREGTAWRFRVLPDQLTHPVIASLPRTPAELAAVFDPAGRGLPGVKRIEFGKSAYSKYWARDAAFSSWEPTCAVEFLQPQK